MGWIEDNRVVCEKMQREVLFFFILGFSDKLAFFNQCVSQVFGDGPTDLLQLITWLKKQINFNINYAEVSFIFHFF